MWYTSAARRSTSGPNLNLQLISLVPCLGGVQVGAAVPWTLWSWLQWPVSSGEWFPPARRTPPPAWPHAWLCLPAGKRIETLLACLEWDQVSKALQFLYSSTVGAVQQYVIFTVMPRYIFMGMRVFHGMTTIFCDQENQNIFCLLYSLTQSRHQKTEMKGFTLTVFQTNMTMFNYTRVRGGRYIHFID